MILRRYVFVILSLLFVSGCEYKDKYNEARDKLEVAENNVERLKEKLAYYESADNKDVQAEKLRDMLIKPD